jgi:hypothetical protein
LKLACELLIRDGVKDGQHVALQDCVKTKRALSWNLIHLKADFRLEPYPLLIDESNDRNGSVAGNSGQAGKIIE